MGQRTLDGTKTPRRNVVVSIQPEWANQILSGNKQWEYRRTTVNANRGSRLILYASGGLHAIVGEATIERVLNEPLEALIAHTTKEVPETPDDIRKSFAGRKIGHAIKIRNPVRYESPFTLSKIRERIPRFMPPQSFYYVPEDSALIKLLRQK